MIRADSVPDDGLPTSEVGPWSLQKYRLLDLYNTLFSTGMKHHWDLRVYIDIFSGPGRARVRKTQRVVETSPIIALRVPDPFDRYIFCDKDDGNIAALRRRVERDFPRARAAYLVGDCNELTDEIARNIPRASKTRTVLSFCFVDPFGIGDLRFDTIRALSAFRMDFLILLALAMDANRFQALYLKADNPTIDRFLGDPNWRDKWTGQRTKPLNFRQFLAREFAGRMISLRYLPASLETMKEVRSDEKNLPLYHLAFFSKHPRGYEFWNQVLKYGTDQLSLFE